MITIFDARCADAIPLKQIDEGECFVTGGTLFRRLYEEDSDDTDIDCEYMYSGQRTMFHRNTMVVPVDITITYTETEDYER